MTPLLAIEKSRGKPILVLAREFADRGLTLKVMATELGINYRSLKQALGIRGYTHPRGIELVVKRIHSETGKNLAEYIQILITEGLSRNAIATKLKIDNKTLQSFAKRESIVFAVVPSSPKNLTNIVHALLSRIPERQDLRWIEFRGDRLYMAQWANRTGISAATLRKRFKMGWSVEAALTTRCKTKAPKSFVNSDCKN